MERRLVRWDGRTEIGCAGNGYEIEARREIKRRSVREGMIGTMGDKRLSEGRM